MKKDKSTSKKERNDKYYVYLVGCVDFYKIGKAKNPKTRLSGLQVGCPYPLKILALKPLKTAYDAMDYETMMHIKFKEYHHQGEWFSFSKEYLINNVIKCFDLVTDDLLGISDDDNQINRLVSRQKKDAFIYELERRGWIPVLL